MRKLFYWLLALAVATTLVVEGLYLYKFGSLQNPTLSSDMAEWGQLGDFIGGTLGTYFGFLAFIGVLFTVLLQSQQLEQMRNQANLDELQRMLATLASNVDGLLYAELADIPPSVRAGMESNQSFTLFVLLSAGGQYEINKGTSTAGDEGIAKLVRAIRLSIGRIVIELDQLVMCLEMHKDGGGSDNIQILYRTRYRAVVCWTDVLGFTTSAHIRRYFDPVGTRPLLLDEGLNQDPATLNF